MTKPLAPFSSRSRRPGLWLPALAFVLAAPGCYHATGTQRASSAAEAIPITSGDRVPGLKSAAGPGDYFIGNDAVCLAVDGVTYANASSGASVPIAGAISGGSIVDAGFVQLNSSYKRTAIPTDMLERLTPVLNQNPDLPIVFDTFTAGAEGSTATLVMAGHLYDVNGILGSTGKRDDISVTHKISLGETAHYFLLETTVTNNTGAALDITSIGDYLLQKGGGYRLNIPAYEDNSGNTLSTWGVEIPGTGSFGISSSVRAPMVGLMGTEPAAATYDAHSSLGILPVDGDDLLVACPEAQQTLSDTRPRFPSQLVVGKPQASSSLLAGKSLSYRRRLYAQGGNSLAGAEATKSYAYTYANQATGVFNRMFKDRATLRGTQAGWVALKTAGSAVRGGGAPTEIRIEDASTGQLVRSEFLEPQECLSSTYTDTNPRMWFFLPVGTYRVTLQNQQMNQWDSSYSSTLFWKTFASFYRSNDTDNPNVQVALTVKDDPYDGDQDKTNDDADFVIGDTTLMPEYDKVVSSGSLSATDNAFLDVSLIAKDRNSTDGNLQPLRWTIQGTDGTPDPTMKRTRSLGSVYDSGTKAKAISGANYGCYAFGEGNQIFGTAFKSTAPFLASLIKGKYTIHATRGPLSLLQSRDITLDASSSNTYTFLIFPGALPSGWTTFDMPGPSMASSGGLLPVEKLSGALAEGVQVVANTEEDLLTESTALRDEFRTELDYSGVSDDQRSAVGDDPFVVPARSSDLSSTGYGHVTALFTPSPTSARNRGARLPHSWTLSDFMNQSDGSYHIVQRPREPLNSTTGVQGLFTAQNPSSVVKTTDTWLSDIGSYAYGVKNSDFDAIELISGQAMSDLGSASAWFTEFKAVRADWFSLLNGQTPSAFTKALGLSSSKFTKDTPVGLARTYLKTAAYSSSNTAGFTQSNLSPIKTALQSGAAVASTGPFVDASIGSVGIGGTVTSAGSVSLTVTVMAGDWVPVDQVRIVVNGADCSATPYTTGSTIVTSTVVPFAATGYGWIQDASDSRKWTQTFTVDMNTATGGKDGWIVVEAGVPLAQTGTYNPSAYPAWNTIMHGIYPVAVTNPIFVDLTSNGSGYAAPGY